MNDNLNDNQKQVIEAYVWIRKNNQSIPDHILNELRNRKRQKVNDMVNYETKKFKGVISPTGSCSVELKDDDFTDKELESFYEELYKRHKAEIFEGKIT